MPTWQFSNGISTTLNNSGTMGSGDSSCVVTSATGMPSSGTFAIRIDNNDGSNAEIVWVGARSGTTLSTLTRAAEAIGGAQTGLSHADGSRVTLVATAAGIAGVVGPGYGAYSSIPGAGNAGRVYKDSDDPILWFDDGSAWHGTYNGTPIVQPPTSGNWTAIVTQTAATMAAFGSGLYIAGGSTTNWSSWYHTTGYSAPKTITAMVQINELPLRFIGVGIFLRLASSGKVVALEVINNNTVSSTQRGQLWSYEVDKWTFNGPSTTTFSATYQTDVLPPSHYHWLRLADTGGNIVSSYSIDGFNWIQLHSVSRTNWDAGGMDQTGIMVAGDIYTSGGVGYGNNAGASLLSWSET